MLVNMRVIDNEDNTRLFAGDEIEGPRAVEQIALGNAEAIVEPGAAIVEPEPVKEEVPASKPRIATAAEERGVAASQKAQRK